MDIQKYNIDSYKRLLGDLAKYEEYVQSYNETKVVEGNKVPKRVYQVVILEPDAVDLEVIKAAKDKTIQDHVAKQENDSINRVAELKKENESS